ncbi:uncharacterized protein B0H64DRAFT_377708 [Chaetomium fimeti]|uniref:Uncharacterized protein n=1 Tax=Chaetomium fimeti TaxID=1854472 RepID=A0AAE0LNF0_9PEZI|nr:hypothetical protein B0H64DRAFT_377708 [Chaetomium fimeti]
MSQYSANEIGLTAQDEEFRAASTQYLALLCVAVALKFSGSSPVANDVNKLMNLVAILLGVFGSLLAYNVRVGAFNPPREDSDPPPSPVAMMAWKLYRWLAIWLVVPVTVLTVAAYIRWMWDLGRVPAWRWAAASLTRY